MNDTASEAPRGRDDLVFRQLDEEWVIYDPATDKVHVLNLTAAMVWTHCTGDFTAARICDIVQESFGDGVDRPAIEKDVQEVLQRFLQAGLLL